VPAGGVPLGVLRADLSSFALLALPEGTALPLGVLQVVEE
jgi:hypothetical protein